MVYAYVLMSNHVHLLIETDAVGLSKIMQGIQFSYTQRYNRRHAAYAAARDKRSESELQRLLKIKSTTHA